MKLVVRVIQWHSQVFLWRSMSLEYRGHISIHFWLNDLFLVNFGDEREHPCQLRQKKKKILNCWLCTIFTFRSAKPSNYHRKFRNKREAPPAPPPFPPLVRLLVSCSFFQCTANWKIRSFKFVTLNAAKKIFHRYVLIAYGSIQNFFREIIKINSSSCFLNFDVKYNWG